MRIIARGTLRVFWERHPETEEPLKAWFAMASRAVWRSPNDVLGTFRKAKVIDAGRVRFEICGGNYRLLVAFDYRRGIGWIKFIGTHAEYDRIEARSIEPR